MAGPVPSGSATPAHSGTAEPQPRPTLAGSLSAGSQGFGLNLGLWLQIGAKRRILAGRSFFTCVLMTGDAAGSGRLFSCWGPSGTQGPGGPGVPALARLQPRPLPCAWRQLQPLRELRQAAGRDSLARHGFKDHVFYLLELTSLMFSCQFVSMKLMHYLSINFRFLIMKEELIGIFFPCDHSFWFQIKYICVGNPETRSLRELTLVVSVWFSETQGLGTVWGLGSGQLPSPRVQRKRARPSGFLMSRIPGSILLAWFNKSAVQSSYFSD